MKIIQGTVIFFLFFILFSCENQQEKKQKETAEAETIVLEGTYLGQETPGMSPEIFAPDFISKQLNERDAAFTPDGKEFYFSITQIPHFVIAFSKFENNRWSEPEVVSFSGRYSDIEPFITKDGKRMYFASNRPNDGVGEPNSNYDIWYADRIENRWGEPVPVGKPVNTEHDEFYPTLADDGTLYFCATYKGGYGAEDIYRAEPIKDGGFELPVNLGDSINTPSYEYNAMIAPDESFLVYTTHGRGRGFGHGDLWVSFQNDDGTWTKPRNLGADINSEGMDYSPSLSPDGKYLFFASNRSNRKKYSDTRIKYADILDGFNRYGNNFDDIYWVNSEVIFNVKN